MTKHQSALYSSFFLQDRPYPPPTTSSSICATGERAESAEEEQVAVGGDCYSKKLVFHLPHGAQRSLYPSSVALATFTKWLGGKTAENRPHFITRFYFLLHQTSPYLLSSLCLSLYLQFSAFLSSSSLSTVSVPHDNLESKIHEL